MSKPTPASPVKLIFSVLAKETKFLNEAIKALCHNYGQADYISAKTLFDYTDYYCSEMGEDIIRRFISMEELIGPEILPDVKLATNKIEDDLVRDNRRRVNIDPGYVSQAHLILATGKGYSHRPYLRDGIYADLTLIFQAGKFIFLPWTYPDYADEKQMTMFAKIRAKYLLQLKNKQR